MKGNAEAYSHTCVLWQGELFAKILVKIGSQVEACANLAAEVILFLMGRDSHKACANSDSLLSFDHIFKFGNSFLILSSPFGELREAANSDMLALSP